jgi:hypothetical protein
MPAVTGYHRTVIVAYASASAVPKIGTPSVAYLARRGVQVSIVARLCTLQVSLGRHVARYNPIPALVTDILMTMICIMRY